MFRDKVDVKDLDKMDPEYRDLLERVLTIQADCEIGGPHLYVKDILPSAPSKLDQLIVARTAAEEVDHYRKIALVAGNFGCVQRHYQHLGGLRSIRFSHRPRRSLPAGRIF